MNFKKLWKKIFIVITWEFKKIECVTIFSFEVFNNEYIFIYTGALNHHIKAFIRFICLDSLKAMI